jgi:hypothetical protein
LSQDVCGRKRIVRVLLNYLPQQFPGLLGKILLYVVSDGGQQLAAVSQLLDRDLEL